MSEDRKIAGALALAVKEMLGAVERGEKLTLTANPALNAQECLDWFESEHGEVKVEA